MKLPSSRREEEQNMKYIVSLGRRLAISLLDSASSFAEKETVVFGAFCTGLATAGALKAAEIAGFTLNATAMAFVGATALSISAALIRQFVGSANFVKIALEAQEQAEAGLVPDVPTLPEPPKAL
jgi:hypothetical protein